MKARIVVYVEGTYTILSINDIICVEADGAYTVVHTANKQYRITKNLKSLLESFSVHVRATVIRVHKSWLVNLDKIEYVNFNLGKAGAIVLVDGREIPIGKVYKPELKRVLLA